MSIWGWLRLLGLVALFITVAVTLLYAPRVWRLLKDLTQEG